MHAYLWLVGIKSAFSCHAVAALTAPCRYTPPLAVGGMSTNPRNTINQLKRLLGKKFSDPHVQEDLQHFPYKVEAGPNGECMFNVSADSSGIEWGPGWRAGAKFTVQGQRQTCRAWRWCTGCNADAQAGMATRQ